MTMQGLFIQEFRRRIFDESYPRILKCLDLLSEEEIWTRPNSSTNSVGNLVLHLCGNAKQWVVSGLGGAQDMRDREQEFATHSDITKGDLIILLNHTKGELNEVVTDMSDADLTEVKRVQAFSESGVAILVHVIEHFSYHTGQIALMTKLMKDCDLGFYAGLDLNAKGMATN